MKKLMLGLIVLGLLLIPLAVSALGGYEEESASVDVAGLVGISIACQAVKDDTGDWNLVIADDPNVNTHADWGHVDVQSNYNFHVYTDSDSDPITGGMQYNGYLVNTNEPDRTMFYKLFLLIPTWPDQGVPDAWNSVDLYDTGTKSTPDDFSETFGLRQQVSGHDEATRSYATTLWFFCDNVVPPSP